MVSFRIDAALLIGPSVFIHVQFLVRVIIMAFALFDCLPDTMQSIKRFSKRRIKELGKEDQVLKEKELMKSLNPSTCVPRVLCTCADELYVGILLDCCLACSLASILHSPLGEQSAKYYAASVIVALEELHKVRCTSFLKLP